MESSHVRSKDQAKNSVLTQSKKAILYYLNTHNSASYSFWTKANISPEIKIESLCDIVYSFYLLGIMNLIDPRSPVLFANILADTALSGWECDADRKKLTVHNTAYALGTLNLLENEGFGNLYQKAIDNRPFKPESIVTMSTKTPRFPAWLSHHNWRVSHWLGGVPSILLSVGRSSLAEASAARKLGLEVLANTNNLLDKKTGLIRLYRSRLLQKIFHRFYALRHDPILGDLGGVVHILWLNHVENIDYVAQQALYDASVKEFFRHRPFMEGTPYCLDFDIVNIVRTAAVGSQISAPVVARANGMLADIDTYFSHSLSENYRLHRLPGALATMHECAFIVGEDTALFGAPIDIIKMAGWL
ncbi:hypothetical protein HHL08_24230 [Sphingobium sp. AR-3-1]|uniref:Uncharacterized protein n=2 Tax=Sphingobium psychrophilum TaxID=2728834 RepID=A0A7X9X093_9SPHN|nr:hypothetical protein [Sphingobium psychrophilum]